MKLSEQCPEQCPRWESWKGDPAAHDSTLRAVVGDVGQRYELLAHGDGRWSVAKPATGQPQEAHGRESDRDAAQARAEAVWRVLSAPSPLDLRELGRLAELRQELNGSDARLTSMGVHLLGVEEGLMNAERSLMRAMGLRRGPVPHPDVRERSKHSWENWTDDDICQEVATWGEKLASVPRETVERLGVAFAVPIEAIRKHPAMLENLTAVQARCTELVEESRKNQSWGKSQADLLARFVAIVWEARRTMTSLGPIYVAGPIDEALRELGHGPKEG